MKINESINAVIDYILSRHKLEHSLFLKIGNLNIRLNSNSLLLLDDLHLYFKEFISREAVNAIEIHAVEDKALLLPYPFREKEPDPGKTRIKEEYADFCDGRIVRKRLTGMTFIFNGSRNLAIGPCRQNSNQIVNFINNRFSEWLLCRGSLLAHAAGICSGKRGIALAGFSGSGKSTVALHLLNGGASFVSNDRLMIRRENAELIMYGIPKHPRVNPGSLLSIDNLKEIVTAENREAFSLLNADDLWEMEHKHDVIIHEHFGAGKFLPAAPLNGLLILNWRRNGAASEINIVNIDERRDLLSAFMKSPGLFFFPNPGTLPPDFSPERYLNMLAGCTVFEATGGVDFAKATEFCLDFLHQGNKQ